MENNSALMNEVRDVYKLQLGRDKFPKSIIPVVDVNPAHNQKTNFIVSGNKSTTGTTSVSIGSTKTVFLTGVSLSFAKDVTCDLPTGSITLEVVVDTGTKAIISLPCLTLAAQSMSESITFPPLQLVKGSTITLGGGSNAFAAGACIRTYTFIGFVIDNPNA